MASYYSSPSIRTGYQTGSKLAKWIKGIGIPLLLIGAILVGILQIQAPQAVGPDAPLTEFSAARAMEKVKVIAKEPHPVGSPAHAEVRDYLMAELKGLGLHPEIQEIVALDRHDQSWTLENIMVRIPGTDNSKALMIAAHYDSVPTAPGAADDGAAIAAMLETVRALQGSGPLRNDLIVLMTDGEELGMLGAREFMNEHPWAKEVGLVFNFEARGNKGPSFMFETSDQNGWIVKEFIKAAPQPIAYSLVYNVYKLMPNDTDLTMFRAGGLAGLNFAFGMGLNSYHTMLDTPENLDLASLQHHGEYMLSLTRHFGDLDLNQPQMQQENRVYFNVFGWKMVSYPESWGIGLMIFAGILFTVTLWYGMYHRRINFKGLVGGFMITLLSLAAAGGVITLAWSLLRSNMPADQYEATVTDPGISIYYFIGLLVFTVVMNLLLVRWISRYIRAENLWAGTLLLWFLLCVLTTLYLPGGGYLFIWPLLFSLVGLNLSFRMEQGAWTWVSALFAIPGLILFTPILYLVYMMMTLDVAGILFTVAALALSLIFPVCCRAVKNRRWA